MLRRIVLIRKQEWLGAAWRSRSFARAASPLAQTVKVSGMQFDETYHPVRVISRLAPANERLKAVAFDYRGVGPGTTYAARAEFEDQDAVERLRRDKLQQIVGVYADPTVSACATPYCGNAAIGTDKDVAKAMGVPALRRAKLTGRRVRVAVVDTGIDGDSIPVAGGWAPDPGYVPGSTPRDHGTMVAYDVRIAAPNATILDYALLRSAGPSWNAFLSDAIAAFADLLQRVTDRPGPLVVNNSWCMFNRKEDAPIGSPENYSANADHPFNQIVGSLVAAGADVFFAAGNCGKQCADGRCGAGDTGPGASIHGANSHPDVVTVAAVTVTDRRLGYSSQGPGGLSKRKPDLAAYSHFKGSGIEPADSGTSAASPVAAGVAAALRQRAAPKKLAPGQLKGILQRTSRDLERSGWDYNVGYGVIDAAAALRMI